jgi:hypothetical protein
LFRLSTFFLAGEITFLYYNIRCFVGLLQFALDGFFYEFVTPGGGWFSNNSVLLIAIVAFSIGKVAKCFKHKKSTAKDLPIV